ncbi:uncharacterized protein PV09_08863 [Verruconis gallopava]|uniref:N-acetylglucosaminylphosphatidylinositol deacetylase n=1 Tax=Verruconis gallopava TaxID=253628 RepID=A0A0D1YF98_9PEZI|nr:uncharacterized protein PV09_08863 [Verruconis gallopava]KIV99431.1 hypothetical protein PV09_08863 [Verruconis gallopava]
MQWYAWASIPVLIYGFWLYTSMVTQRFPTLQGKRILLLIAHPDDEAMFFAPTLLALSRPELGNHIKILCLSSGDADGLGETRKKELVKSGLHLGLRSEDDIMVIEDPNFPDSMTTTWDAVLITKLLTSTFAPTMSKLSAKERPKANIDVLITFDADGVSSHPNHKSLYHGCVHFLRSLMVGRSGWDCPVTLYTLATVPLVRKYLGIFDAPATLVSAVVGEKKVGDRPTPLLFVSNIADWRTAQGAMTTAHKSQMRWFRWGWIGLSRYMVINNLSREKIR